MKKILALLLAMLLCLGVLVACNDEEPSSSSSEAPSSSNERPSVDEIKYYFHKGFFENVDSVPKTKIELVHNLDEYSSLVEGLNFKEEGSYGSFKEGLFETHYLLKVTMCSATRGEILGYRDFSVSENGELSLTLDNIFYYDAKTIDSNGNVLYEVVNPANDSYESDFDNIEELPSDNNACYDFVLIPKDSVSIEVADNTEISLYIVMHPVCRN